jgi:hypothetical protein
MASVSIQQLLIYACIGVAVLAGLWLIRLLLRKAYRWNRRQQLPKVLNMDPADPKLMHAAEARLTPKDATPSKVQKNLSKGNSEKIHSFLTINKEQSERDHSGLISFSADNNLKLDTIQHTENDDADGRFELDIEENGGGQYIDTSAKNSTKNSNRKNFFLDYSRNGAGNSKLEDSRFNNDGKGDEEGEDGGQSGRLDVNKINIMAELEKEGIQYDEHEEYDS